MDQEKAYRVLNLDQDASFSQAKQAYRRLAKTYHPDLVANENTTVDRKKVSEELLGKMKEINLAFSYLGPILLARKKQTEERLNVSDPVTNPPETEERKKEKKVHVEKDRGTEFNFFQWLKDVLQKGSQTGTGKEKTSGNKSEKAHNVYDRKRKKESFDEVFRRFHDYKEGSSADRVKNKQKRPLQRKQTLHQGYQNYIKLKKRMMSVRRRTKESITVQKIEKIKPVRPVNPVGGDQ